jgi:demethylmenaquinone methyltransferase/2-methoxy-6-polyprenyl-1,4-benzoquinol methylase
MKERYPPVTELADGERIGVVKEIFSTVTVRYDFLNRLLSLRRDVAWRSFTTRKMRFFQTFRLLDIATGTADLAIDAVRNHPFIEVVGLDFVKEMLDLGRAKIEKRHLSEKIRLLQGDALSLPFRDNSFDVAAIAFGMRNIPSKTLALEEMRRILVPGGQAMILEMTSPPNQFFKTIYHFYLSRILPQMARPFSQNPAAYYYLGDSIKNFPTAEAFVGTMEEAGFARVEKHSLDFGITYLHIGVKPGDK